jgi:hypothetical protein
MGATLAIFRPRRIARWKNRRHSASLRTVTCAASTNKKRSNALPCLLICPGLRSLTTGIFLRNQTQIARDLFATSKPFRLSDDEHNGQHCQRTHPGMGPQSLRDRKTNSALTVALPLPRGSTRFGAFFRVYDTVRREHDHDESSDSTNATKSITQHLQNRHHRARRRPADHACCARRPARFWNPFCSTNRTSTPARQHALLCQ